MTHYPSTQQAPEESGKGKRLTIAGLVLGVAALLAAAVFLVLRNGPNTGVGGNDVSVSAVRVGHCVVWKDASSEEVDRIRVIGCAEPHDSEVFAEFDLPDGRYDDTLHQQAEEGCNARFAGYAAADYEADETIVIGYLYPQLDSWSGGARTVSCYASKDGGKLTGTIKG